MPKYAIDYSLVTYMYVVVEADDENEAEKMLIESVSPATDIGGEEPDFISTDIDYDYYSIVEVKD